MRRLKSFTAQILGWLGPKVGISARPPAEIFPEKDQEFAREFYASFGGQGCRLLEIRSRVADWPVEVQTTSFLFLNPPARGKDFWVLAQDNDEETVVFALHSDGSIWYHDVFFSDNKWLQKELIKAHGTAPAGTVFIARSFVDFLTPLLDLDYD
jgi:hypothetical protein